MATSAPPFPVPHNKLSLDIKGNKTDIIISSYDDHFLVIATQIGSMGTILHASFKSAARTDLSIDIGLGICGGSVESLFCSSNFQGKEEGLLSIHPTFHVSVIFGKRDEPMLVTCARQLIEHISSSGSSRPLVLSLGLKDHSVATLKGIVSAVIENRLW